MASEREGDVMRRNRSIRAALCTAAIILTIVPEATAHPSTDTRWQQATTLAPPAPSTGCDGPAWTPRGARDATCHTGPSAPTTPATTETPASPVCPTAAGVNCESWSAAHADISGGLAVTVSPDDETAYVTGFSGPEMLTVAHDAATGEELWASTWRPDDADLDLPLLGAAGRHIEVSPDGSTLLVLVEIAVVEPGCCTYRRAAVVGLDAVTGAISWGRTWHPLGHEEWRKDMPVGLALAADARTVYAEIATSSLDPEPHWDMVTWALDTASGEPRWTNRYDGPLRSQDLPSAVLVGGDGGSLYAIGSTATPAGTRPITLVIDAATGVSTQVQTLSPADVGTEHAVVHDATLDPISGLVITTGPASVDGDVVIATIASDPATGTTSWRSTMPSPPYSPLYPFEVSITPDGGTVLVSGGWRYAQGIADYFAAAIDTTSGARRWVTRVDGNPAGLDGQFPWYYIDEIVTGSALTPDGDQLLLTGWSGARFASWNIPPLGLGPVGHTYHTIAVRVGDGEVAWRARYSAAGGAQEESKALGIAVGGDGSAYVTGWVDFPQDLTPGMHTVAYPYMSGQELPTSAAPPERIPSRYLLKATP